MTSPTSASTSSRLPAIRSRNIELSPENPCMRSIVPSGGIRRKLRAVGSPNVGVLGHHGVNEILAFAACAERLGSQAGQRIHSGERADERELLPHGS